MNPTLHRLLATERARELRSAADGRGVAGRSRRRRTPAGPKLALEAAVTIRYGFPDDERALRRLAALDSSEPPGAPVLVAEVDGELRAALSLSDGAVVADPFHVSAALTELLLARARQLSGSRTFAAPAGGSIRSRVAVSAGRAARRHV
jgi:hypothetical protein